MLLQRMTLTALLTLVATLTISDFPLIPNPKSQIQNSQVLAQTLDARKAEANRLLQQGIGQYQTSQFEAALQSWQQALTIYREIKDRKGEGWALGNLGNAYYSLGNYALAIDYLKQVLAIAKEIHDRQSEGKALGNLGNAYNSLGDYAQAIDYQKQHLAIAKEIHDRQGEGKALGNLGIAYKNLGDYAQAIDYYKQQLAIAREIHGRQSEGMALGNLGNAYGYLGDYAQAIDYHKQSLAIAKEIHDRRSEGGVLGNLGDAYNSLGDYAQAIDYHKQSLAIAKEIHNRRSEGMGLDGLGVAYNSLGDYAQAIDYHKQSLAIAKEIHDRQGEGQVLGNLGDAYNSLGDSAQAINYHKQSLAIAKEIHNRRSEGMALGHLGVAYNSLGDSAQAINYHKQSLAIAKEIHNRRSEGMALGDLGVAYKNLGDYAQAINYHKQSLAIAQEIHNRHSEGGALGNLGLAYDSLGDYAQAIDYHKQSLAIAREIHDRQNEGAVLNNLGAALRQSGNLAEAEKTLIEAISLWESQRARLGKNDTYKVSIYEGQANTYRTLQKVLIAQNKTNAALEIAERGRARAFVELLTQRLSTREAQGHASLPTVERPTIEQIKQIASSQDATLVQYSIIYDGFKVQGKQQTHESELYIWVISPTGEVTFRRRDLKPLWQQQNTTLAELVFNSRDSIGVRGLPIISVIPRPGTQQKQEANLAEQLQQLHKLLIEPIADQLPNDPNKRVIFIPQRSLFLVPFAALQDSEGKYLIEKHTILSAPSIQVLQLTRQQQQSRGSGEWGVGNGESLVVGNPTMPSVPPAFDQPPQQLPSLPGAEKEAEAIAPLLNTKAIIGKDATKSAIEQLMPKARIIHLATHGLLDDVRGIGSAIALAPSGNDDGLLTAEEILNLKLNAQLVVLSACNTGRGRITGDGVIGLSRALISAGVPSVLVSLWSVSDAPTASLMTEFYQNLQKNPDKAQALRQAMLTTMKQHPEPKNWAAFTLIGEAN